MNILIFTFSAILIISFGSLCNSPTYVQDNSELTERIDSLNGLAYVIINTKPNEGKELAENAFILSKRISYLDGIALSSRILGWHRMKNGEFAESLKYYNRSYETYKQLKDSAGIAVILKNINYIYITLGNVNEALETTAELMALDPGNKPNQINALSTLSIALGRLDEIELAIEYEHKALQLTEGIDPQESQIAILYGNLCYHYSLIDELDKAEFYGQKALSYGETTNINPNYVYNSLGDIKMKNGRSAEAILSYNKAVELSIGNSAETKYLARSYLGLGEVFLQKRELIMTKKYLQLAFDEAKKGPYIDILAKIYKLQYQVCNQQNQYKQALKFLVLNQQMENSIFNLESRQKLARIKFNNKIRENKLELENERKKVLSLTQQQKINKLKAFIYLLITICISICLIVIFIYFRQKFKKNKEVLKSKNDELIRFALYVVSKNTLLDNLKSEISKIRNTLTGEKEIACAIKFQKLLINNLNIDKSKKDFQQHLKSVCQEYFYKLEEKYPNLSKNDKLLSALVKINLSSKEIAALTNISMAGVNVGRSRLRKKMGLQRDQNLVKVLNRIN